MSGSHADFMSPRKESLPTMNFRTTLALLLILALGIFGVVYMNRQDTAKEEAATSSRKILAYSGTAITALHIEPGNFQALRDSSGWVLSQPIQSRADSPILNAITSMFDWAKIERTVSSDPREYASFGLLPPRGVLVTESAVGRDTLYVGDDSPIGSFVYARKAGTADVFLASSSLWTNINKSLFDLRDKTILSLTPAQVTAVEIKNSRGLFNIVKNGEEWQITAPRSYPADSRKITELLNNIQYQKAASVAAEEAADLKPYGLALPLQQFRFRTSGATTESALQLGRMEGGVYFARDASRSIVFTVDSSFVRGLQLGLDDLRDKQVLEFARDAIDGIELSVGDTTFVCQKDSAANWQLIRPRGAPLRSWRISSLLSDLETLTAEGFASDAPASLKPFGLEKPPIRCRLLTQGVVAAEVLLGSFKDAALMYGKSGSGSTVYLLRRPFYEKLNLKLTDLVETSSPAAGSATE